jgi:hypothetical protein
MSSSASLAETAATSGITLEPTPGIPSCGIVTVTGRGSESWVGRTLFHATATACCHRPGHDPGSQVRSGLRWSKGDSNSPSHPERPRSEGAPHGSGVPLSVSESRPPEKRHRSAGLGHGTGRGEAQLRRRFDPPARVLPDSLTPAISVSVR